ncbi:MAG TPA: bpX6 domain-containing protein [Polyangiaceae bacterium]|nr:bpX6 domain-containing protein [Polyangiaceae bacterium]
MTAPPRPRALVHRGVVPARGFVVDERTLGRDRARARVLEHWEPGARVVRLGDSELALLLPRVRWTSTRAAPGAPLAAAADALAAAPLAPSELAAIAPARGAIVQVKAGEALAHARPEPVDPSLWLDLSPFELVEAGSLGEPPALPRLVAEARHASAREVFAEAVKPPPPEMREALEALANAREGRPPGGSGGARGAGPGAFARAALAALGAFAAFAAWLASGFGLLGRRGRPGGQAGAGSPSAAGAAPGPGWLAPLLAWFGGLFGRRPGAARPAVGGGAGGASPVPLDGAPPEGGRLRALFLRLLMRTRLGAILGRRQAEYVRAMLRMFDEGDLDQALRHAIPLSDKPGGGGPPALGVPQPRADLTIGLGELGRGPALRFSENLFDHLRRLYRQAFERLDAQGRHQEAAFVLAELLRQSEEAVSYLERKGELRLAAELAEARALPPPLVIRQWMLARDPRRAVLIARRHDAFAQAVERLGDSGEGKELRALWAENLAEAGRYLAAVEVAQPLPEAQRLRLRWADLGVELGGEAGARLLAMRPAIEAALAEPVPLRLEGAAGRGPLAAERGAFVALLAAAAEARRREAEAYERLRPTLEGWLEAEGPGAHALRLALAEQLTREAARPAVRAMAGATLRALLRDYPTAASPWGRRECMALARASGDAALEADLPPLPERGRSAWSKREGPPLAFDFDAPDAGSQAVYDAAPLPGGRLLVALGEAGALLLGRTGKRLATFPRPAHRLVVSDEGDRAIALAPRGGAKRLSRLNLLDRRSDDWCDARVERWAETFDGERWVVASRAPGGGPFRGPGPGEEGHEGERGRDPELGAGPLDLWVVDVLDERWQALHRVPDVGALALLLERVAGECVLAVSRGEAGLDAVERWRFRPACETLLERSAAEPAVTASLLGERTLWAARGSPQLGLLALEAGAEGAPPWLASWSGRDFTRTTLPGLEGEPLGLVALGTLVAVASRRPLEAACAVGVWDAPPGREARKLAALRFQGAGRVSLRASRGLVVACDDAGRVVSLDAESGALAHDVRV